MVEEFWGTLSIYDHRDPIFIRSLILFDRIVIPIPENPFGTLTSKELKNVYENAKKLEKNKAAVIYSWKLDEFEQWETETMREALALKKTDKLYHTRMQGVAKTDDLKKQAGVEYVSAAPVYGARKKFEEAYSKITLDQKNNLTIELGQLITVPEMTKDPDLLDKIIALRGEDKFKSSMLALRDWQDKIPEVVPGEDPRKTILKAKEKFEQMLEQYEEEIKKAKFKKTKSLVTSILAVGGAITSAAIGQIPLTIALMAKVVSDCFSFKESLTPSWKDLAGKNYECAGVIFEGNRILK